MDDVAHTPPAPAKVMASLERSLADIAAGRLEDFDTQLARLSQGFKRLLELEQQPGGPKPP